MFRLCHLAFSPATPPLTSSALSTHTDPPPVVPVVSHAVFIAPPPPPSPLAVSFVRTPPRAPIDESRFAVIPAPPALVPALRIVKRKAKAAPPEADTGAGSAPPALRQAASVSSVPAPAPPVRAVAHPPPAVPVNGLPPPVRITIVNAGESSLITRPAPAKSLAEKEKERSMKLAQMANARLANKAPKTSSYGVTGGPRRVAQPTPAPPAPAPAPIPVSAPLPRPVPAQAQPNKVSALKPPVRYTGAGAGEKVVSGLPRPTSRLPMPKPRAVNTVVRRL